MLKQSVSQDSFALSFRFDEKTNARLARRQKRLQRVNTSVFIARADVVRAALDAFLPKRGVDWTVPKIAPSTPRKGERVAAISTSVDDAMERRILRAVKLMRSASKVPELSRSDVARAALDRFLSEPREKERRERG